MISWERDFKLKVYPSLGMALVFPLIFLFNNLSFQILKELGQGKSFLTIYFSIIIIGTVVHMLQYSAKYKGAWIFRTTPIQKHAIVYRAALKAMFVKLYLPIIFVLSLQYIWIFSIRILPDLAVVFVIALLQMLIAYKLLNNGKYPFTEPIETAQQGGGNCGDRYPINDFYWDICAFTFPNLFYTFCNLWLFSGSYRSYGGFMEGDI